MGVYYADGGTWAFNHTVTYTRRWNGETKEYEEWGEYWEEYEEWEPSWGLEIKMFDGWLVLDDVRYRRVDE